MGLKLILNIREHVWLKSIASSASKAFWKLGRTRDHKRTIRWSRGRNASRSWRMPMLVAPLVLDLPLQGPVIS